MGGGTRGGRGGRRKTTGSGSGQENVGVKVWVGNVGVRQRKRRGQVRKTSGSSGWGGNTSRSGKGKAPGWGGGGMSAFGAGKGKKNSVCQTSRTMFESNAWASSRCEQTSCFGIRVYGTSSSRGPSVDDRQTNLVRCFGCGRL